jgi:electron transport complex protein RnfB
MSDPLASTAVPASRLAAAIDALLPQTQCRKCGYAGCRPYAEAIAAGNAAINRCPPGGVAGIAALAALTGRPQLPLDPACGSEGPRRVAVVDEAHCIGCTLCIQACPVDAIVGAPKQMHGVIAELCTGCELCLPPCPVDCIDMVVAADAGEPWNAARRDAARKRFLRRAARLEAGKRASSPATAESDSRAAASHDRQALIRAAVERARARREARAGTGPGGEGKSG